jgi:cell division GTPase FtsZ
VNTIPFDKDCADLVITNSISSKNEPIQIKIFNNQESINIGLFLIPDEFDKENSEAQIIHNYQSFRNQFDALLLMNKDSNFTHLGFKEIISNDKMTSAKHYRNVCFDFESFKEVFKSKSIAIMTMDVASGANRAIDAVHSVFLFPNFYRDQIVEIKNTIVCVSSGKHKSHCNEKNDIGKYSLNLIKRGYSLSLNTLDDMTLEDSIRVSALISGFDTTQ